MPSTFMLDWLNPHRAAVAGTSKRMPGNCHQGVVGLSVGSGSASVVGVARPTQRHASSRAQISHLRTFGISFKLLNNRSTTRNICTVHIARQSLQTPPPESSGAHQRVHCLAMLSVYGLRRLRWKGLPKPTCLPRSARDYGFAHAVAGRQKTAYVPIAIL